MTARKDRALMFLGEIMLSEKRRKFIIHVINTLKNNFEYKKGLTDKASEILEIEYMCNLAYKDNDIIYDMIDELLECRIEKKDKYEYGWTEWFMENHINGKDASAALKDTEGNWIGYNMITPEDFVLFIEKWRAYYASFQ